MHRTARLLALAGCLALGAGLLLLWWLLANDPPVAAVGGSTPTPAAGGAPASAAGAGDDATRVAVTAPPATVRGLEVRGRCLAAESGEPIAGATVHVVAGEDAIDFDDAARSALAGTASGGDGRFACTIGLPPDGGLRLIVRNPGRATLSGHRNADAAGELWDVGDVLLPLETRVRGEVVDATGEPVAEAEVTLVRIFMERPAMTFRDVHHATTDARGAFAVERAVAAGEWFLAVDGTGALRAPRKTEVPAGGEHFVHIEVERPDPNQAILGRAVDRGGQPLAGVSLSATGEGSSGRATSRADGTFRIHRGAPRADTGKRGVDLFAQAPGLEQVKTSEGVAWGQHDVEVVMQSLATVVVRALDASGRPVRGFDVLHARLAADGLSLIDYAPPNVVDAGDGSVRLSALRSGAHVLLLRAHDERLAVAGPIPFAVDDASSREVLVHVCDRNQTEVEVVDTAGAPVPACELDLIAAMARAPVDGAMPAPRVEGLRSEGLRGMRQVSLAHGSTDASGVAHLGAPPGSFSLCLRCETHLPLLAPVTIAGTASRLRLVMEPAAVLHGRLVPAVALRAFAPECDEAGHGLAVVMRGIEPGGRAAAVDVATAEVGADGTFRLGALPAGTFRILLRAWLRCSDIHSAAILHALGDIDVAAGARMERDFPVDAYLPAAASGVVLLDAEPVVGQQFFLQRIEPAPRLGVRVATDGNGRFQTRLPPGVYQPQLAIPAQPGPGYVMLPLPQRCAIAAGASEDLRIEACARRLRLRVLGSDGAPLANRRIRTDNKNGYYRPGALATDEHGVVELQPAPYGTFFLFAPDGDRAELTIGPLELPPGDGAAELEFRVGG